MNQPNKVVVRVLGSNPLKDGHDGIPRMEDLGSGFTLPMPDGTIKKYQYLDERGKEESMIIRGSKEFDLNNLIEAKNFKTLQVQMAMFRDDLKLHERLQIIDPDKDANLALEKAKARKELKDALLENVGNKEWLAALYRHVVGSASGLNEKAMWRELDEKANGDLEPFRLKSTGRWFWLDEEYDLQSLLNLGIEKQLFSIDRESGAIKDAAGKVFAKDRQLAIYLLKNDPEQRRQLERQVAAPVDARQGPVDRKVEDSDLIRLMNEVGVDMDSIQTNDDGSVDEGAEGVRTQEYLKGLAERIAMDYATIDEAAGTITLPEAQDKPFANIVELVGYLKGNPELVKQYEGLFEK